MYVDLWPSSEPPYDEQPDHAFLKMSPECDTPWQPGDRLRTEYGWDFEVVWYDRYRPPNHMLYVKRVLADA